MKLDMRMEMSPPKSSQEIKGEKENSVMALDRASSLSPTQEQTPLCTVHADLDRVDKLELHYGHGCVACSLNERDTLLDLMANAIPTHSGLTSVEAMVMLISAFESNNALSPKRVDVAGDPLNSILLLLYELTIANAPLPPADCRDIATKIADHVGTVRATLSRLENAFLMAYDLAGIDATPLPEALPEPAYVPGYMDKVRELREVFALASANAPE